MVSSDTASQTSPSIFILPALAGFISSVTIAEEFIKESTFVSMVLFEKYFLKIGLISKIEHKDIAQKIINSVWNAAPSKEKIKI